MQNQKLFLAVFAVFLSIFSGLLAIILPAFPLMVLSRIAVGLILLTTFLVLIGMSKDRMAMIMRSSWWMIFLWGFRVPPARLGISVLQVIAAVLMFGWIAKNSGLLRADATEGVAHPQLNWLLRIVLSLCLLPVVFSIAPAISAFSYAILVLYVFYAAMLARFLENWDDYVLFHRGLLFSCAVLSLAVVFEAVTGINLSGMTKNLNALEHVMGLSVNRPAGLFQDPQKAAQFLGCALVYFTVLAVRGRLAVMGIAVYGSAVIGIMVVALLLTVSRLGIASGLVLFFVFALLFNRLPIPVRLLTASAMLVIAGSITALLMASDNELLPKSILARFQTVNASSEVRFRIWTNDFYHIFKRYPATGIGLGTYQENFMREHPNTRNLPAFGGYVPDQPESGYLKILYEGGIIGGVAGLIWLLWFVTAVFRSGPGSGDRTSAIAALGMLLVFLVSFITIFTPSDGKNALIPIFLTALALSCLSRSRGNCV